LIIFSLVCIVLVAIALAFVLPPLLERQGHDQLQDDGGRKEANVAVYRDQIAELDRDLANGIISPEQHQQDRDELERRLLEDVFVADGPKEASQNAQSRGLAFLVALGLPILALSLYLRVGNYNALALSAAPPQPAAVGIQPGDEQGSQQRIEANIAVLAKRLEQNPNDVDGWIMLARSYTAQEKYSAASAAFAKATKLKTNDAELWADYAFAMAMANGRRLQGQPAELINKALKLDPQNPKALELAGSAAFEAKDYKRAIQFWRQLLQKTPAESELGKALAERIEEAQAQPVQ